MADASSSNLPSLEVLGGDKAGARFVFEEAVDNVLIGADPSCRFCLDLPGVSPVHARIWIDDTGITIYDTNSPRGLFVNDDRVEGQVRLRNGDIIWLGSPGDEQSVMIQCRVPGHEARPETVAAPAEAPPAEAAPQAEPETAAFLPDEAVAAAETVALRHTPIPPSLAPPPAPKSAQEFEEDMGETQEAPAPAAPAPVTPAPEPEPLAQPVARPAVVTPRPPTVTPAPSGAHRAEAHPAGTPGARPTRPVAQHAPPRPGSYPRPKPRGAGGGAGRVLAVVGGVLVLAAAAAAGAWYLWLRPQPARVATAPTPAATATPAPAASLAPPTLAPEASAAPTAAASPEGVEEVIPVTPAPATPTPRLTPTPRATPTVTPSPAKTPARPSPTSAATPSAEAARAAQNAARVAGLIARADQAFAARNFDAAVSLYDEALGVEPGNGAATTGRANAASAAFCWKRSFVPGRTVVQAGKGSKADLQGFESSDVKVAKADFSALVDFQASPVRVIPGEAYSIKATLTNDGRKAYRLASLTVSLVVNGNRSSLPATVPPGDIQPKQGVAIAQTSGNWPQDVRSWSLEVVATTAHGETFTSQLTWR